MCAVIGILQLNEIYRSLSSDTQNTHLNIKEISQILRSLGNRGHDAVGVDFESVNDAHLVLKGIGSVADFLESENDEKSKSDIIASFIGEFTLNDALLHIRYATSSGKKRVGKGDDQNNIHPIFIESKNYHLSLIENGETYFPETKAFEYQDSLRSSEINRFGATNDTSVKGMKILKYLENLLQKKENQNLDDMLEKCLGAIYDETFDYGMFSTIGLLTDKSTISKNRFESRFFVMRDGGRPLHQFDLDGYRIFCSESSPVIDFKQTLSIGLNPKNEQDFPAGRIQIYDKRTGELKKDISKDKVKPACFFEYVYMKNYNSYIYDCLGNIVYLDDLRAALGVQAFLEHPDILKLAKQNKDCVVLPVPNSAISYVKTLSEILKVNVDYDILKKSEHYDYRTFIATDNPLERVEKADKKFKVAYPLEGKTVILFDDSLVRYTNAAVIIKKLLDTGAYSVIPLLGTPPIISPCRGGVDMYEADLATSIIEKRDGISAKAIGDDYFGTGAHKDFENALCYFEHESPLYEYFKGPIKTDGFGFISRNGLNSVFDRFNLRKTAQCCITKKYPYKFDGMGNESQFIPSAEYPEAIKGRVIA